MLFQFSFRRSHLCLAPIGRFSVTMVKLLQATRGDGIILSKSTENESSLVVLMLMFFVRHLAIYQVYDFMNSIPSGISSRYPYEAYEERWMDG